MCADRAANGKSDRHWPAFARLELAGTEWAEQQLYKPKCNQSVERPRVHPQRFAIDWVQLQTEDSTFTGDPKDNTNYKAYGSEVLAVADATVTMIKDGIPQNVPGEDSRAPIERLRGNHIILDFGGGN